MNILVNRDYHEVIGEIIPIDIPEDLRLGNSLLDRIPQITEFTEGNDIDDEIKTKINMGEDEIKSLLPRLNFNLPEEMEGKMMEKIFISQGDYWGLYELYKTKYPFSLLNSYVLYSYCRTLVKNPITKADYNKISSDIKTINRQKKIIEKKKWKKNKGNYNLHFN